MPTTNAAIGARVRRRSARRDTSPRRTWPRRSGSSTSKSCPTWRRVSARSRPPEVARLAELFRVSPSPCSGFSRTRAKTTVLWRHPAEERARQADEAAFLERCRRYAFVERLSGINPATLALGFNCEPERTSYEAAATWGEQARDALGSAACRRPASRPRSRTSTESRSS